MYTTSMNTMELSQQASVNRNGCAGSMPTKKINPAAISRLCTVPINAKIPKRPR